MTKLDSRFRPAALGCLRQAGRVTDRGSRKEGTPAGGGDEPREGVCVVSQVPLGGPVWRLPLKSGEGPEEGRELSLGGGGKGGRLIPRGSGRRDDRDRRAWLRRRLANLIGQSPSRADAARVGSGSASRPRAVPANLIHPVRDRHASRPSPRPSSSS